MECDYQTEMLRTFATPDNFPWFKTRLLNTYQGPIRIAIPIRINPQKLTHFKKACRARKKNYSHVTMINDGTSARRAALILTNLVRIAAN
jgi:hypothetical protein